MDGQPHCPAPSVVVLPCVPLPSRRASDALHAELDELGRLILERVDADPLARLAAAGQALWDGVDAVEHQQALRAEWPE